MTTARKQKIQQTLDSRNFFVSLVSLILLFFTSNGLDLGVNAAQIVDIVGSNDLGAIVGLIAVNFFNPLMKVFSKGFKFDWAFLRSPNFITQLITAVLSLVALLGVVFPPEAATEITNSFSSREFLPIAMALVINVANPLWHFFFDPGTSKLKSISNNTKG